MNRQAWGMGVARGVLSPPDPEALRIEALRQMIDRDDPGHPLGRGMPTGETLREDGESHRQAWMRTLRVDPCAYCGVVCVDATVDHVEPRQFPARGLGGAHTWLNFTGACAACNWSKSSESLLEFLYRRAHGVRAWPQTRPRWLQRAA